MMHPGAKERANFGGTRRHGHLAEPSAASGMTLLEVVVSIAVLTLLLGILLPSIMGVRAKGTELECLTRLRSISGIVQTYAADSSDSPPSWISSGVRYESTPSRWREYASQGWTTFENEKWFDYADLGPDSETHHCPANSSRSDVGEPPIGSDYRISTSLYIRPAYLEPALPASEWYGKLGAGVQRLGGVRFPSEKVSLFEYSVWHGWQGRMCDGCDVGDLQFHNADRRGSIIFVDGHGEQRVAKDAVAPVTRYPIWPLERYGMTPRGVLGRDFN